MAEDELGVVGKHPVNPDGGIPAVVPASLPRPSLDIGPTTHASRTNERTGDLLRGRLY